MNQTHKLNMPTLAGISIVELGILAAAGYVVWKNRTQIESLLESAGVEIPGIFHGDFSQVFAGQSAASAKSDDDQYDVTQHALPSRTGGIRVGGKELQVKSS